MLPKTSTSIFYIYISQFFNIRQFTMTCTTRIMKLDFTSGATNAKDS